MEDVELATLLGFMGTIIVACSRRLITEHQRKLKPIFLESLAMNYWTPSGRSCQSICLRAVEII